MPKREEGSDTGVIVKTRRKVKRPRLHNVVMHNDDYTTQEFVVGVLQSFFHRSETDARRIMLTIHRKGRGVAGTYSKDIAESKAAQVTDFARSNEAPLMLTVEPA